MRRSRLVKMVCLYPVFLLLSAVILYPVIWMVYSSFKPTNAIYNDVFSFPTSWYWDNYSKVFSDQMGTYFLNSVIVSFTSVTGLIILSSLAGYGFAFFKFRGSTSLYLYVLIGLMIPPQALIISGFKLMSNLNLLNTYWALIFSYFGWVSFGILVLRNFFQGIPYEITDAARVDGAGHWSMYLRIMLPLARPSIATIGIFYFMWIWNDFIYPLVYMQSNDMYTVPLGIMYMNGQYEAEWGLQMAGLTIATMVPLLVYYMFQKQFIRGITAGALKG